MNELRCMEMKSTVTFMITEDKTEIENIVKRFIQTLNPLKIYLFGSFARGEENSSSDYDFYIIIQNNYIVTNETTSNAYLSLKGLKRRPVDIIINNKKTFDERSNSINTLEDTVKHK